MIYEIVKTKPEHEIEGLYEVWQRDNEMRITVLMYAIEKPNLKGSSLSFTERGGSFINITLHFGDVVTFKEE